MKNIWDSYGNWDEIANAPDAADIQTKIKGNRAQFHPNFCPPAVSYALELAASEFVSTNAGVPTALDYGCGLGRNAPLLKKFIPEVIGLDIPAMVKRFQLEYPKLAGENYRHIYDSISLVAEHEAPCIVYDSVVLQHIIDVEYLAETIGVLSSVPTLRTFVSVYQGSDFPGGEPRKWPRLHLRAMEQKGWRLLHAEVESLSFNGIAHVQAIYRR